MDNLTVAEVVNELEISRSYLYKVIKDENIIIDKSTTGRYIWNNEVVHQLKLVLDIPTEEEENIGKLIEKYGLRQSYINNRRYLGNKYSLSSFIRQTVEDNCSVVNTVVDIFSGTGAVADVFKDKMIITNDLLYSNYISNYAWFYPEEYSEKKIIEYIAKYNSIHSSENNYMRENFADTFFSADDCSKIGIIREDIEVQYKEKDINFKEYTILITSLLYGIDRIANTVGHYDAYRKNAEFEKPLDIPVILPSKKLNENNNCYNLDANKLIENTQCDLLYLDPPYNSRQYCDAYHLLENVARWEKPKVYGVAKKMDRISLKSEYCTISATEAFKKLIEKANARYILLSYNNMSSKGNDRSNAKINDEDILKILEEKGNVKVFKQKYKSFTTGKSDINDNAERLFLCETFAGIQQKQDIISPLNYIGGKFELLTQLKPLFPETSCFLDLFSGGGNVGINSEATKIIFNDKNKNVIDLLEFFKNTETKSLLKKIDEIIKEYGLSNTSLFGYEYYGCNSSKGLSDYNKDKFLKLRNDFNNTEKNGSKDLALLYVLIVFSFNNQIRFNRKGEFNLPVGKRDFNSKMRSKLILFSEALKRNDISFLNKDFREIDLKLLPSDTFIYCDPPYLITTATYNENGSWTNKDEIDLLNFLNKVNKLDFKFALSNVLSAKNKINVLLKEWIEINGYNCHSLLKSYSNSNYQRKNKNTISEEVLITNY